MKAYTVTRAHLKSACDARNWDLLDKLLELDASQVDDRSLYTDTWGVWWGLLMEAIRVGAAEGVAVLLKHGASRDNGVWGDGEEISPREAAAGHPEILAMLDTAARPDYVRRSDPPLPESLTTEEVATNRQGEIRDRTGLLFQRVDPEPREES